MIASQLLELQQTWGYTIEELNDIKIHMANYALAALMDSEVRKEAEEICKNQPE